MNKRGFTLIEIIVCVILISMVGVSTILIVNNNEQANDINKKILSAANIFVEVEKDENGNNYLEEIVKGAKGVKIPVSMLIDKGYINKGIEKELYKNTTKKDNESYYIMFLSDGTDYCDKNEITALASWMEEGKTVYLCNSYNSKEFEEQLNNISIVNKITKYKVDLNKYAVSEEFYNNASDKTSLTKEENGLYTYYNEDIKRIYTYYRGAVENNYLKLGKDKNGNDLIWRILWFSDENKMKLVLDEEVVLKIKNKAGNNITIKKGDFIQNLSRDSNYYYILNPTTEFRADKKWYTGTYCSAGGTYCDYYYFIKYKEENLFSNMISLEYEMNDSNNIYFQTLQNWYQNTNLETYNFITKENNFCKNTYHKYSDRIYSYYPSDNFDCKYGDYDDGRYNYTNSILFYSSAVGYLTYGEALRAGLTTGTTNINNSNNFLLSKNNNYYPLVDNSRQNFYTYRNGMDKYWQYYYIAETGVQKNNFYITHRIDSSYTERWYTLVKPDGTYVYEDWSNQGPYGLITRKTTFYANSVKPAIVIDMSEYELNGKGTETEPFTIIDKKTS